MTTTTTHPVASHCPVGYNSGMKTAVSIPDPVFRAADKLAKRMRIPRSRLYALALADYIDRNTDARITERLNASYAANPPEDDPFIREAARRALLRSEW